MRFHQKICSVWTGTESALTLCRRPSTATSPGSGDVPWAPHALPLSPSLRPLWRESPLLRCKVTGQVQLLPTCLLECWLLILTLMFLYGVHRGVRQHYEATGLDSKDQEKRKDFIRTRCYRWITCCQTSSAVPPPAPPVEVVSGPGPTQCFAQ